MKFQYNLPEPKFQVFDVNVQKVTRPQNYRYSFKNGREKHGFIYITSGTLLVSFSNFEIDALRATKGEMICVPKGSIYNGTGYKTGYRIRSGGAEAAQTGACHTGFIPVLPGAIVRLTGWNFSFNDSSNAVNFSDGSFTNLGQFTQQPSGYGICANAIPTVTIKNNVYQFTVPNNTSIRYIRVTGQHAYNTLPPEMIITINEEIE
jgi:hypothetical protein